MPVDWSTNSCSVAAPAMAGARQQVRKSRANFFMANIFRLPTGARLYLERLRKNDRPQRSSGGWRALRFMLGQALLATHRVTDETGIATRVNPGAEATGVDFGKLGAEEKNCRRIINPHENQDQRAGGAKARGDAARPEIQTDEELPDREQNRRHGRANPHIFPVDLDIRQHLENECEEHGENNETYRRRDRADEAWDRQVTGHEIVDRLQYRAQ